MVDEGDALLYAVYAAQGVGRGVENVVGEAGDGSRRHVQAGVAGGVVDVDCAVGSSNGAVGENDVADIAYALIAHGGDEVAAGLGDHAGAVVEGRGKSVDDVPETRGGVTHAVGDVDPAPVRFDGHRARAVFALGDGVIAADGGHLFLVDDRVRDVIAQAEADASAAAGLDEIVHRAGIEGVFAVYEFRVKQHVPLLRRAQGLEVGQALPVHEVVGAHDARRRDRRGEVGGGFVLAFGAEHAVDPAVLVLRQAHVVHVGLVGAGVGQKNGPVPKAEALHAAVRLGDREKALPVPALHAGNQRELAVQQDRAAVEGRVDAEALHHVRVGFGIRVIHPEGRHVIAGQNGVLPAVVDAVIVGCVDFVPAGNERFVFFFNLRITFHVCSFR